VYNLPDEVIKKKEKIWWYVRPINRLQPIPWKYEMPDLNFIINKTIKNE